MRNSGSKSLYKYWNNLRRGRKAPERGEIEPSDIRNLLSDTFILEVDNNLRTISFRLAGTRLCTIYGRELKGYGYLGLWEESDNLTIIKCIAAVYRDYIPAVISHTGFASNNRSVGFETLVLPLLPTHDGNIRILGVSTLNGECPYWIGADKIELNSVASVRSVTVELPTPAEIASLAPRIGQLQIAGTGDAEISKKVGHLRVIEGGKQK